MTSCMVRSCWRVFDVVRDTSSEAVRTEQSVLNKPDKLRQSFAYSIRVLRLDNTTILLFPVFPGAIAPQHPHTQRSSTHTHPHRFTAPTAPRSGAEARHARFQFQSPFDTGHIPNRRPSPHQPSRSLNPRSLLTFSCRPARPRNRRQRVLAAGTSTHAHLTSNGLVLVVGGGGRRWSLFDAERPKMSINVVFTPVYRIIIGANEYGAEVYYTLTSPPVFQCVKRDPHCADWRPQPSRAT